MEEEENRSTRTSHKLAGEIGAMIRTILLFQDPGSADRAACDALARQFEWAAGTDGNAHFLVTVEG